jgi:hypothetical protein
MKVGGVELVGGKIVDLIVESIPTPPVFDASDAGQFTFSESDGVLRFNNGLGLVALNTTVSENPNLIQSLGSNWLNSDLSFNPAPFNVLDGISGLTTDDSLFQVIEKITENIQEFNTIETTQLVAPPGTQDLFVLTHLAGDLIFLNIETLLRASSIDLNFDNLNGFNITSTTQGNMLVFDGVGDLVSRDVSYTYQSFTANDSHVVNHNLGQMYVSVFCINPSTNKVIQPLEVEFITNNQLLIRLTSSQPLIANVTNFRFDAE